MLWRGIFKGMDKRGRLLIVDDEVDIREVLRESLADHVDLIFEAGDGAEALEKLQTISVHAILSDINMPKMSGLELLRNLRKMGKNTPFIVLTGFGDKEMAIQALRLGAFDFLEKPFKEVNIIDVVDRAIELGKNIEHWGDDQAQEVGLETIREETAAHSIRRLEKSIGGENVKIPPKKKNPDGI